MELYHIRLCRDVKKDPDRHYCRVGNIQRSTEQMVDTLAVLQQVAVDIDNCESYGNWYQNTQACNMYNSACEYLPLCMGISDPSSDNWVARTGGTPIGERTLSHSRISCFQLCRRKYFWRYVEGIERDRPTSDALTFGKAFHQALEAWWLGQNKENLDVDSIATTGDSGAGSGPAPGCKDDGEEAPVEDGSVRSGGEREDQLPSILPESPLPDEQGGDGS